LVYFMITYPYFKLVYLSVRGGKVAFLSALLSCRSVVTYNKN